MTDERQTATRGARARQVMENPLVVEAFEKIEKECLSAFRESRADEHIQRENAYVMLRLISNLKTHFLRAMGEGEVARKNLLKTKDTLKERMFGRG